MVSIAIQCPYGPQIIFASMLSPHPASHAMGTQLALKTVRSLNIADGIVSEPLQIFGGLKSGNM